VRADGGALFDDADGVVAAEVGAELVGVGGGVFGGLSGLEACGSERPLHAAGCSAGREM